MIDVAYKAILLDLDGTLVDDTGEVLPETRAALRAARARGVRTVVATGRSELHTRELLLDLEIDEPAIVFNGAALWCPVESRLIEERILSDRTFERARRFASERDLLFLAQCAGEKLAVASSSADDALVLRDFYGVRFVDAAELAGPRSIRAIRATVFSRAHGDSAQLALEVEAALAQPIYTTHFPLSALAQHRDSDLHVVDVQPPCRGKAEALRLLDERYGIAPAQVVAVGDATNDLPMFRAAGLSVCMGSGMPEAQAEADRVIGSNNEPSIARLIEELFL